MHLVSSRSTQEAARKSKREAYRVREIGPQREQELAILADQVRRVHNPLEKVTNYDLLHLGEKFMKAAECKHIPPPPPPSPALHIFYGSSSKVSSFSHCYSCSSSNAGKSKVCLVKRQRNEQEEQAAGDKRRGRQLLSAMRKCKTLVMAQPGVYLFMLAKLLAAMRCGTLALKLSIRRVL